MIPQQKLLRLFTLIRLLKQPHTIGQLAVLLETNVRTVYRYLALLGEIGYLIDSNPQTNQYFLFEPGSTARPLFTPEETAELQKLLASLPPTHTLGMSIRRKLHMSGELVPLADELHDRHLGRMIDRLNQAIEEQKQVRLVKYQSARSNTISTRVIEPKWFTDNYALLWAYDHESAERRSFKISRMEDVEVLTVDATHAVAEPVVDAFGWSGAAPIVVTLQLSLRAYRLLYEEYPAARAFLLPQPDSLFPYVFRGEVYSYIGIGRFVLGLPGEIRVTGPAGFRDYLEGRVGERLW
ncbi:helix-turn-helix transcriptional regulator [Arsenicibacter rosenii]|uniref:Uncharacterized protein n=1 Tax=Arsenicibacter rosenii TaxID=1750698 RepID=A0A1S2VIG1_9BACT|nr:WYL domain-containing protein [Arsenicibacter rosenii]OIN58035.1 hypothetical protein BLX24_16005 [Arsenicibacter rosenii]